MKATSNTWKKGRGKLGVFQPLLGSWVATGKSEQGSYTCTRTFTQVLGDKYIQLKAVWRFGSKVYEEYAMIGMQGDEPGFWSFTSDGKHSQGKLADGSDVHPQAICFEAQMPAGLARMIYWPDENTGFRWAVEAKNKKGWNRFTAHHYKPNPDAALSKTKF